jgi:hypothetical protein
LEFLMAFKLPPPPNSTDLKDLAWRDWFYKLGQAFTQVGSILWSAITLPTVPKNTFLAGPTSGADSIASFRTITTADLPAGIGSTIYISVDEGTDGDSFPIPGVQGPQGNPGVTGPQGPIGFSIDGEDGNDGMTIPGTQGPQGNPGITGPQGPIGFGLDGVDGEDATPIPGPQGASGTPGINGSLGLQGPMGLDGQDGEDAIFIPGPMGPQGPTGASGSGGNSIGIPGQDGEDGVDSFIYLSQVQVGGGSGLTHPQVLTRVSFRI